MPYNESARQRTTVPDKNVNLISSKSEVKATWTEQRTKKMTFRRMTSMTQ